MTRIALPHPATVPPQSPTPPASAAPATGLTPARFSDMYRSAIAAAVDQNGDGSVSAQEYAAQLGAAGGADARLASLDRDGDGKVSTDEFAAGVADPLAANRAGVIERTRSQIAAGMSTEQPLGRVLGADGKASDPDAMLRFLANRFPGNVDT